MKVLIIDDIYIVRSSLEAVLKDLGLGFEVECVGNPTYALRIAKTFLPDIAFVDVNMPNVSGLELIPHLLEVKPMGIIVCSGVNDAETITKALKVGANDYILKPIDAARVQMAISKVTAQLSIK